MSDLSPGLSAFRGRFECLRSGLLACIQTIKLCTMPNLGCSVRTELRFPSVSEFEILNSFVKQVYFNWSYFLFVYLVCGDTLVTSIQVDSHLELVRDTFGNKQTHCMNPNKEYHDLQTTAWHLSVASNCKLSLCYFYSASFSLVPRPSIAGGSVYQAFPSAIEGLGTKLCIIVPSNNRLAIWRIERCDIIFLCIIKGGHSNKLPVAALSTAHIGVHDPPHVAKGIYTSTVPLSPLTFHTPIAHLHNDTFPLHTLSRPVEDNFQLVRWRKRYRGCEVRYTGLKRASYRGLLNFTPPEIVSGAILG